MLMVGIVCGTRSWLVWIMCNPYIRNIQESQKSCVLWQHQTIRALFFQSVHVCGCGCGKEFSGSLVEADTPVNPDICHPVLLLIFRY
jgi:hypothetical protein